MKQCMKDVADKRNHSEQSEKCQLNIGDHVLVKMDQTPGKLDTPYIPKPYIVHGNHGTMVIAKRRDYIVTRNKAQFSGR